VAGSLLLGSWDAKCEESERSEGRAAGLRTAGMASFTMASRLSSSLPEPRLLPPPPRPRFWGSDESSQLSCVCLTLRSRLAALLPPLALFTLLRPTAEGAPSLQSHLTQTAARVACGRSAPLHDRQSRHLHADASWHTEGEARKMGAKPRGRKGETREESPAAARWASVRLFPSQRRPPTELSSKLIQTEPESNGGSGGGGASQYQGAKERKAQTTRVALACLLASLSCLRFAARRPPSRLVLSAWQKLHRTCALPSAVAKPPPSHTWRQAPH
jgi:hypothetical protein